MAQVLVPVPVLVLGLAQALAQDSVPARGLVLEQAAPDQAFPVRSPAYMH